MAWQFLNAYNNSSDSMVAGRPLSNPHTHLHSVVLGEKPGLLYLGTHYGLFTSTDGGHTWPQSHGTLSNYMVTSIAESPSNPNILALIVIPTSGLGLQVGSAFSRDNGASWKISVPSGLSSHIQQISYFPMTTPPTRIVIDKTGNALYALSGQDLWLSSDQGGSWVHRWHFDRDDLISLVVDPQNFQTLYAGFFLPPEVIYSTDGGNSWQTLTD